MMPSMTKSRVLLHRLAHARTGDKGNRINIGLFPYDPSAYEVIASLVTAERVHELYRHKGATRVDRYDLPNLCAFNFVIDDVLEGGVNGSLNLDGHGKSLAFHLLALEIEVAPDLVERARAAILRASEAGPK